MKHLDLFSGYGGFTIPARKYNIETIGFSEIDKYACSVLNYHYPNIKNYGDITKIKAEDLPTVDIITGGSPCQDLSAAGKGAGLNGERSGLFFHFIRLIKEKQPTYFVWENVKGALSSQGGWDFARVQIEMEQAGYDVWWQVLNAKDFGVPQNRERIFAIGIRKGSGREVLFEQISSGQNNTANRKIKSARKFGSSGSFHRPDEIVSTLTQSMGTGGNNVPMTIGAKTGLCAVGMIDVIAKKRVHDTPVEINKFLRLHRKKPIGSIADKLALPKTQVEHYFRTDSSRAIPSPEIWIKLKELLGFDDTYDKQVTEFYEKEVEFESTRRVYDSKGVAKTTDTAGTGLYAVYRGRPKMPYENGKRTLRYKKYNEECPALTQNCATGDQMNMIAVPSSNGNVHSLDANYWKGSDNPNKSRRSQIFEGMRIRRLTPVECERLMGLEDNWTAKGIIDGKEVDISDTQRYKMCGNGVVVNVVDYVYKLLIGEK